MVKKLTTHAILVAIIVSVEEGGRLHQGQHPAAAPAR
jgi:hypothetical protein